jgi:NitT/TauT family transport system substrate-binding protein
MRKSTFRRAQFFLILQLLPFAGCHRAAAPAGAGANLTKISLQADWYPQPEHGGFYTALAKGYYREEGLDVSIVPGGPFAVADKQVAAGAAEFGMDSSDHLLEAVADGQPLIAVAATMQRDPQGIMVRKDSAVRLFEDLNGHTIAVKPGSTWFEFLVKRYHLDGVREIPATYSVANFVADPHYIQQAFATSEPFFAKRAGIETRVLLTSDAGYNPYRVMFTTQDFLRQRPEIVAKFVRASLRGWRDYLQDPTAAHAVIIKLNPALNPEWMQFSWQALRGGHFVAGDDGAQLGQMVPERWATMAQQLSDLKMLGKPVDPAAAYTLQFVGSGKP